MLIPAKNARETVRSAVISVLRGVPDAARVLVLNDASDDDTGAIVADLARRDARVGVLEADKPVGVAKALNALIEAASTPLIARMDADDLSLPWRFRTQLRALERIGADVVFANAIKFGPQALAVRPQPPVAISPEGSPLELLLTNTLLHPTLVGKKSAFTSIGGYRTVPAEDWDLWMRLALAGCRMARLATFTLLYRRHSGQVTADVKWRASHAADSKTALVHEALAEQLVGRSSGAYAALHGVGDHGAAVDFIDEVCASSRSLGWDDRLAIRVNATAVKRITRRMYVE